MKAGDEKVVGGKRLVWVICPDCDRGRWAQKCQARLPLFTGRCKDCYMKIAKQEMGRYYAPAVTSPRWGGRFGYTQKGGR